MSFFHSPRIVTDGLVTYIDAGNPKCYPGTGTIVYNLANPNETGSNNGSRNFPTFTNDNLGNFYFNNNVIEVQCDVSGTVAASSGYTIEAWCNRYGDGGVAGQILVYIPNAIDSGDGGGDEKESHLDADSNDAAGQFRFFTEGTTSPDDIRLTSSVTGSFGNNNSGSWYHVCSTLGGMNGPVTPVTASLYVNGQLQEAISKNSITRNEFTGSFIRISGPQAGSFRDYHGDLAVVKIYNKALTEQEVLQNFNALRGRFGI